MGGHQGLARAWGAVPQGMGRHRRMLGQRMLHHLGPLWGLDHRRRPMRV